jgi:lantibiotic modifying enzyme
MNPLVRAIVERGASLRERLGQAFISSAEPTDQSGLLAAWKKAAADDDETRFSLRLAALGLTTETAWKAVSDVSLVSPEHLPTWTGILADLVSFLQSLQNSPAPADPSPGSLPADPASAWCAPIVQWSRHLLDGRFSELPLSALFRGENDTVDSASLCRVEESLTAWLSMRLSRIAESSLSLRFSVFQNTRLPGFLAEYDPRTREVARQAFVEWLDAEGRLRLFEEFPGLARLTAIVIEQWLGAALEMLQRFAADRAQVVATLLNGIDPGALANVKAGLSDPHGRGRSVIRLIFADGRSIMYKPRDLKVDQAWEEMTHRLEDVLPGSRFGACRVLPHAGYGWMEFAPTAPNPNPNPNPNPTSDSGLTSSPADNSQQRQKRVFRHAGIVAAVVAALGSTDLIRDNAIDGIDGPVLIDLETLFPCPPRPAGETLTPSLIRDSVLASFFPPCWESDSSQASGIGGMNVLAGDCSSALADVESGWNDAVAALRRNPEALLPCGLEDRLGRARCRVIIRDTSLYERILKASWQPEALRSGVARSLGIERLFGLRASPDLFAALLGRCAVEVDAIENLDIPRFEVEAGGHDLFASCPEAPALLLGCFPRSPLAESRAGLNTFLNEGRENIDRRLFLESCRYLHPLEYSGQWEGKIPDPEALAAHPPPPIVPGPVSAGQNPHVSPALATAATTSPDRQILKQRLRNEALAIGERLLADGIPTSRGTITWLVPAVIRPAAFTKDGVAGTPQYLYRRFDPMNGFVMSGQAGVALFLSALSRLDDRFRTPAKKAWRWFDLFLQDPLLTRGVGIGGVEGLGSIILSLSLASRLLDDPSLRQAVQRFLSFLTPKLIDQDRSFDVIAGAAGTVLSLYGAERRLFVETNAANDTASPAAALRATLRTTAAYAANHLLRHREQKNPGETGWPTLEGASISGFGHGVAGIAAALHLAAGQTGNPEFSRVVSEALAFEKTRFRPEAGNWLAFDSTDDEPVFWHQWCHGAAGIGLSRLLMADLAVAHEDIETAVKAVANVVLPTDHVCCGESGRLLFLLEAGRQCHRDDWENLAWTGLENMLARLGAPAGRFRLPDDEGSSFPTPGLFRGTSGIGLLLLHFLGTTR